MATNKDFIVKNGIQVGNSSIISVNNTTDALRITQTGTGNALLIEDSANPDSTPVVVDTSGKLLVGVQTAVDSSAKVEINGANISLNTYVNNTFTYDLRFRKSRNTTPGSFAILSNNDAIGTLNFFGDDGTKFENAARIDAYIDGTPGVNVMPGKLVFSTTAAGANTATQRLVINNQGVIDLKPGPITSNFYLGNTGANPIINFDSTDYLAYDRTSNSYAFYIGGTQELILNAANTTFNNEIISIPNNAFRAYGANRSAIIRNDNSDFYILVTANNDPYGTWNSYRPFTLNLATGNLALCSTGNTTSFGGDITIPDNKNLYIGTGNDLSLYHGGINSYINNATGALTISNATPGSSITLQANSTNGSNFELTDSIAYLDSATTNIRSQNGGTTFATFNSTGLTVAGNLVVNGTTTTVNSTTVTVDDPIITLGGDTAPAADDNKDRGVEFRWHNGSAAKVGFFGFDDSTGKFTFIPDATNTSEVFSGTSGTISANILESTVATGTAPLAVTSTTLVTNLNADLLDGYNTGTSGAAIPVLSGINTWANTQTFSTVNISGELASGSVSVSNTFSYFATTNSANQALCSVNCRSVEFLVQANTTTEYYVSKILTIQDGTSAFFIEYGNIATGNNLSTFECDVSAGNIRLLATPLFSNTTYKISSIQTKK
jgi:hypothetical protein